MEDASEQQQLGSRLVRAGLEERRQIERALHDGIQQDLIGISVHLQLVRELVATAPGEALASLEEVHQEVRDALDRVRALGSDIYPAILDARGLPDALRQAVRTSSEAAASVEVAELRRCPAEVEGAVYFVWRAVLDGLEASEDARIWVWAEGEALRVRIEAGHASNLGPVGDLVEGVGGTLTIRPGSGRCFLEARFPFA